MSRKPRRILLKFGSGILTRPRANALDAKQFARLTAEVAQLVRGGCKCVIVSSGAVAAGMRVVGLKERPHDLTTGQACAAVGQSKMMHLYASMFAKHQLNVAQLLLTHGDLDSRTRYQNAKNTLERLLECKNVVPVINENDSVAVEELRFGDNDRLSAEVAMLVEAELLIMLTSVDGLMDHAGKRIPIDRRCHGRGSFRSQRKRQGLGGRHGLETRGRKTCDRSGNSHSDRKRSARWNHPADRGRRASRNTVSYCGGEVVRHARFDRRK